MNNQFFLPYQERWIRDGSRLKIMEKSRQIGLSWAAAYRSVRESIRRGQRFTWICSRDLPQAKLFLNDCKQFAEVLHTCVQEKLIDKKKSANALYFQNGSQIHMVSSCPDAQAGKRGTRILDEFALHEDPEHLYNIAYPGITWGGQLEIISTHRGANNFFNRLLQDIKLNGNPKNFSLHRVTLVDALEQGFLGKLKAKLPLDDPRQAMDEAAYFNFIRNACAHERIFQQEYMCQPADDEDAFIAFRELEPCFYPNDLDWQRFSGHDGFLGVDLARSKDFSVFVVLERIADTAFTRHILCLKDARFDQQEQLFDQLMRTYPIRHVCIDQSGIGGQFTERAQRRWGTHCVSGLTFTSKLKETLAYRLKMHIERRQLRLPKDSALIDDFLKIRLQTDRDVSRFVAPHTSNGHSDRFWAFALALHAADPSKHASAHIDLFESQPKFL